MPDAVLAHAPVVRALACLGQPRARARPAAPGPSQHQRGEELEPEQEQVAGDDTLRQPRQSHNRRQVVKRDRKRQKGNKDDARANPLSHASAPVAFNDRIKRSSGMIGDRYSVLTSFRAATKSAASMRQ
jgi:hypothetical protein